jgi:hypothetical protein
MPCKGINLAAPQSKLGTSLGETPLKARQTWSSRVGSLRDYCSEYLVTIYCSESEQRDCDLYGALRYEVSARNLPTGSRIC